ncbi:MAG TPA: hypothetical protein VFC35_07245 [Gemmatimonadaceae bacterium]|nr:hypothetical protein [Gemmatimonadaceae bacterium]
MIRIAALLLCVSACAAPAKVDKPRDQMSQREKDSSIAASSLPGSGVVKRALAMSDAQARQQAALDSASEEN